MLAVDPPYKLMKEHSEPFLKSAFLAAYYASLSLVTLLAFFYVIFSSRSLLYLLLVVPFLAYFLSMLVEVDAYATASLLIANFTKYRKIHPPTPLHYHEPTHPPSTANTPSFISSSSSKDSRLPEEETAVVRVFRREKERSSVRRVWGGSGESSNWLSEDQLENAYKRQRNLYKMTQVQLKAKKWQAIDNLQTLTLSIKEKYQPQVIAIVNKLENKIIEFFQAIEKYYDIYITEGNETTEDLKIISVTPEEVYVRMEHYGATGVLPWQEKIVSKQTGHNDPAFTLLKLYKEILAMDRIVSPFAQLDHKSRTEKVVQIRKEMKEVAGLNVLYCVVGIHNAKKELNSRLQLFLVKENDTARLSIEVKWYNDKLMTNLIYLEDEIDKLTTKSKEAESKPITLYSQPGELNIWNTMAWTKVILANTKPIEMKKTQRKPN